jgi:hypothetical protein
MPTAARLRYALYLAAVIGAALGLLIALASTEAIALLPMSTFEALFSPLFFIAVYAVAFVVAPWAAERLPLPGQSPVPAHGARPPFGFAVRALALVVLGLGLALLIYFGVLLLGRLG